MTAFCLADLVPFLGALTFTFAFGVRHNGLASSVTSTLAVENL